MHTPRHKSPPINSPIGYFNKAVRYKTIWLNPKGIKGKNYLAHRLVWLWHTGSWPTKHIDHIDRDATNNRIENLRDVAQNINQKNQKMSSRNSSGHSNVFWHDDIKRWVVALGLNGKQKHVGCFKDIEDAIIARDKVILSGVYGFTEHHGSGVSDLTRASEVHPTLKITL